MTLVDFDKVAPVLQIISQGCLIWNLVDFFTLCFQKSPKWITTVQCTLYSVHRNHTLRNHTSHMPNCINSVPWSHINSIPWMNEVTPTPYHECTQFVDSVKSLSFSLIRRSFVPIAYIHGTKLVWLRSFMVGSWCELVRWPCGVQKSA